MNKATTSRTIRVLLTVAILIPVWSNSHWSVALILTLLSIRCELVDWTSGRG